MAVIEVSRQALKPEPSLTVGLVPWWSGRANAASTVFRRRAGTNREAKSANGR